MPRTTDSPKPKARYYKDSWTIFWNYGGRRYAFAPGYPKDKKSEVELARRQVAAALASPTRTFPEQWRHHPAVERYLDARYGKPGEDARAGGAGRDPVEWLAEYEKRLREHCTKGWAETSRTRPGSIRPTGWSS